MRDTLYRQLDTDQLPHRIKEAPLLSLLHEIVSLLLREAPTTSTDVFLLVEDSGFTPEQAPLLVSRVLEELQKVGVIPSKDFAGAQGALIKMGEAQAHALLSLLYEGLEITFTGTSFIKQLWVQRIREEQSFLLDDEIILQQQTEAPPAVQLAIENQIKLIQEKHQQLEAVLSL